MQIVTLKISNKRIIEKAWGKCPYQHQKKKEGQYQKNPYGFILQHLYLI